MANLERIAEKLSQSVKPVDDVAGAGEAVALAVVSRAASWGASVPNTVMVARSAESIFSLSWGLSLGIAISLEAVGHALVEHWQSAKSWNETKRKTDEPANVGLALWLMIGYWVLDFVMVGVLALSTYATKGDWRIFTACLYPLIGVAVAVVTSERAHLFRLKAAVEAERQERAEKRSRKRESRREPLRMGRESYAVIGDTTRERARAILAERPAITGSDLGRALGRSPSLGRKLKRELLPAVTGNRDNGR
jgi:hypothetical protein